MRLDADEPERSGIRLLVDEHQIRSDVAVTEVRPRTAERMIMVERLQRGIGGEGVYDRRQTFVQIAAVTAAGFTAIVALEPMYPLGRPHAGRQTSLGRP